MESTIADQAFIDPDPRSHHSLDFWTIGSKFPQPARRDGYRPIAAGLWGIAYIGESPSLEAYRLFSSAARRLDTGHRQIERVRDALNGLPPEGNSVDLQTIHDVFGDAEMALWVLEKAIQISISVSGRFKVEEKVPAIILKKKPLLESLRDHYSHIDERALGRVGPRREPDPKAAEQAFDFGALLVKRVFTDGCNVLHIDEEMTELCIETRNYLARAWGGLVMRQLAAEGVV